MQSPVKKNDTRPVFTLFMSAQQRIDLLNNEPVFRERSSFMDTH